MKNWYAVYAHARKEGLAAEHLSRQGFDAYFPQYMKRRAHARRVDHVPAPLFPRYLFVAFDASESGWRVVRSTRGVIDLVRNGAEPMPVPQRIVEEIRARQDDKGFVVLAKHLKLARGSRIRIAGAFAAHEAIFEARKDDERVTALLSLLGRQVTVQIPIADVMPLE